MRRIPFALLLVVSVSLILLPVAQGFSISQEQLEAIKSEPLSESKEPTTFNLQEDSSSSEARPAFEPFVRR